MLERFSLGHELVTDVVRLQFPGMRDQWEAYSIGYAVLLGAAETLNVPDTDLNVTITGGAKQGETAIVLYDNVPGGAGLVAQLEREAAFSAMLDSSRLRVRGGCGCDSSCYGCLQKLPKTSLLTRISLARVHLRCWAPREPRVSTTKMGYLTPALSIRRAARRRRTGNHQQRPRALGRIFARQRTARSRRSRHLARVAVPRQGITPRQLQLTRYHTALPHPESRPPSVGTPYRIVGRVRIATQPLSK